MRLIVPADTIPADWSPSVSVTPSVSAQIDAEGITVQTGEIYTFAAEPALRQPGLDRGQLADAGRATASSRWHGSRRCPTWVLVPYELDVDTQRVYIEARHFSTYTTAVLGADALPGESAEVQADEVALLALTGAQIDAITMTNVKVIGDTPAMTMGTLYQAMGQSTFNSAQNAVAAQQQAAILSQAATTEGVATIYIGSATSQHQPPHGADLGPDGDDVLARDVCAEPGEPVRERRLYVRDALRPE